MSRLRILKTYKLFIGGQFPRSESGRYYELRDKKDRLLANISLASRKDLKAAVVAARTALTVWENKSAYNRSQILYRMAEMLEARRAQFMLELQEQGASKNEARQELDLSIDRLVYYAGWCDKYQSLFSSVNPVASPHFNFSFPENMGVIGALADEDHPLLGVVSMIAPILAGGNTCVLLVSEDAPMPGISFAEVLANSDLPPGAVNLLSGTLDELGNTFASHMDINALVYAGTSRKTMQNLKSLCSSNLKRFFQWDLEWTDERSENPYLILDLQEIKSTWHPIERNGSSSPSY